MNMGKDVVIKGIVMQEAGEGENLGPCKIKSGEKECCVYAEGKQAIRDWIFIRTGQHVIVEGEERTKFYQKIKN